MQIFGAKLETWINANYVVSALGVVGLLLPSVKKYNAQSSAIAGAVVGLSSFFCANMGFLGSTVSGLGVGVACYLLRRALQLDKKMFTRGL